MHATAEVHVSSPQIEGGVEDLVESSNNSGNKPRPKGSSMQYRLPT